MNMPSIYRRLLLNKSLRDCAPYIKDHFLTYGCSALSSTPPSCCVVSVVDGLCTSMLGTGVSGG